MVPLTQEEVLPLLGIILRRSNGLTWWRIRTKIAFLGRDGRPDCRIPGMRYIRYSRITRAKKSKHDTRQYQQNILSFVLLQGHKES